MTRFIDAVRTVPRVSAQEWPTLGLLTRWAVAARASVLLMTFMSGMIGGLLSIGHVDFDPICFVLALVGLVFAHATNNLHNDYVDSARGVDKNNYHRAKYGTHVLESGLMTQSQHFAHIVVTGLIAIAAGLALVYLRGGLTLALMLTGAFFVLFYTWPLKYIGMGEPAVLVVWGPLMTAGTSYVCTGEWDWMIAAIGTVYALGPTSVIFGKHIDKLEFDRDKGIRTLPVMLGYDRARRCVPIMLALQLILTVVLVAIEQEYLFLLITLLNLPATIRTVRIFNEPKPAQRPDWFRDEVWPLWYAPNAFALTRRYSGFFLLAVIAQASWALFA